MLQTWVLRPLSADLQKNLFPFIYALPEDFQKWPWPAAAAGCEQEVWVASPISLAEAEEGSLTRELGWSSSLEFESLSTHPQRLFAELMHIAEQGV